MTAPSKPAVPPSRVGELVAEAPAQRDKAPDGGFSEVAAPSLQGLGTREGVQSAGVGLLAPLEPGWLRLASEAPAWWRKIEDARLGALFPDLCPDDVDPVRHYLVDRRRARMVASDSLFFAVIVSVLALLFHEGFFWWTGRRAILPPLLALIPVYLLFSFSSQLRQFERLRATGLFQQLSLARVDALDVLRVVSQDASFRVAPFVRVGVPAAAISLAARILVYYGSGAGTMLFGTTIGGIAGVLIVGYFGRSDERKGSPDTGATMLAAYYFSRFGRHLPPMALGGVGALAFGGLFGALLVLPIVAMKTVGSATANQGLAVAILVIVGVVFLLSALEITSRAAHSLLRRSALLEDIGRYP